MSTQKKSLGALSVFCRHLVALTVLVEKPDGTRESVAITSFVLEVRGIWILVTAGHIVEDLMRWEEAGVRVIECGLFGAWNESLPEARKIPVPFNIADAEKFAIDEHGIDVGIIELHPMQRRALEADGIEALDRKTWASVPDELDGYFVVGMPTQFIEPMKSAGAINGVVVNPVLVSAKRVDEPPEMKKSFSRFYGQVGQQLLDENGEELREFDGMSGGPVFGWRKLDTGAAYYLVGIQSGWRRDLRVIAATPAQDLACAIEAEIEKEQKQSLETRDEEADSTESDYTVAAERHADSDCAAPATEGVASNGSSDW